MSSPTAHRFNATVEPDKEQFMPNGGTAVKQKYGRQFFQAIGRLGAVRSVAARRQRAEEDPLIATQVYLRQSQLDFLEEVREVKGRSRSHWMRIAVGRWEKELRRAAADEVPAGEPE